MEPDIQQIVREVVAEIERLHRADSTKADPAPSKPANAAPPCGPAVHAKHDDPRELTVCSRVVSLTQIGDRLDQIRRLVVSPGAILTPAVRDALDDRGITVSYDATDGPAARGGVDVFLAVARAALDPGGLIAALTTGGIAAESQAFDCLIRAVDALADRARNGSAFGVVLTSDTAAALCLANRLPGVRAVSASCPTGVIEAARAVGANVLVVDPRGKGVFQLKQIVAAFCREKPWPCPKALEARLGGERLGI
ncbi:MAG TPA: hypothetical protein DD670_17665 [Planctomycetaceae bacterium]|nr:hypothetical protein [Planctomycetaceae bacterium]